MQVQCIGGGIIPRAFLVQGPWNEGRALVEGIDKASCVKSEKVFFLIIYIFNSTSWIISNQLLQLLGLQCHLTYVALQHS